MPKINLTDLAIQRLKAEDGQVRYFDQSTPGFGILVGKKSKTFFVVTGKERRMQTLGAYGATTLKEARSAAKTLLATPSAPKAKMTYQQAVEAFEKARKPHLKTKTQEHYHYFLNEVDLKGSLSEITRADVKKALTKWDTKPGSANACFSVLQTFFNYWVGEEVINRNPIHRVSAPHKAESRARVLTDEEIIKVWNATDHKPYGYICRLSLLTAGRKNEIRNLLVEGDTLVFKKTKNGTDHHLPITPLVRQHVMEPYQFNNWSREKVRLNKRTGITDHTIHDLRRTWSFLAGKCGVRPEVIERVLNHKRSGIVAVYQRYEYREEMENALLTVEAYIVKLTTPRASTPEPSTAPNGVRDETVIEKAST